MREKVEMSKNAGVETRIKTQFSRRELVIGAGATAGTLMAGRRAWAAGSENVIRVGFISPRTGPLAGFGEGDSYVLEAARRALATGLQIGDKTYQVEILDRDTQSDPARAGQLAKSLINSDQVDMILTTSTPETVNPVSDASEAAGVPCLSTIMPWEAWYFGRGAKPGQPSPFRWTYHFSFGGGVFFTSFTSQWRLIETNKKVAVMYPNDADGNAVRATLGEALKSAGYVVVDPGPYEDGTSDYYAQINLFKKEGCEIFNTFPLPPDFAAFWRQAAQLGWTRRVKIAQIAKSCLFPSEVGALGDLGYGLSSGAYWHPSFPYKSALTGLDGPTLASGFEAESGKQWNQQLGASLSLIDAGISALKASTDPKNKDQAAKALSTLKTEVMTGPIDFTAGPVPNVSPTPIIGTQWKKAAAGKKFKLDYVVTENAADTKIPIGGRLEPYNG